MKTTFAVCLLLLVTVLARTASAQEEWAQRYNGIGNGYDSAKGIAVDSGGYVYVTGTEYVGPGDGCATVKYDTNGKMLWVEHYAGASGAAITVDSHYVYIAGSMYNNSTKHTEYITIKYDKNGKLKWVQTYKGGTGDDDATAIALDSQSNVYVTGWSLSGSKHVFATVKYQANGKQQWVQRYSGPGDTIPTGMAVDTTGNVCVTGVSHIGNGSGYLTIKYDATGRLVWAQRHDGMHNTSGGTTAIAVDGQGNVFVTGHSYDKATSYDYVTIKYNSAGVSQWIQRYSLSGNWYDGASDIALDKSGNVYVTGDSSSQYATIKYDTNGRQLWVQRGAYVDGNTAPSAIAVDNTGNVFVTGATYNAQIQSYECTTVKYDTTGKQIWIDRYSPVVGYSGYFQLTSSPKIAVDNQGNVFVTGGTGTPGDSTSDYVTIKYAP